MNMKTYTLYLPQRYDHKTLGCSMPVSLDVVTQQLGQCAPGFTVTTGLGYWQGTEKLYTEPEYVVEIVTDRDLAVALHVLLAKWKEDWNQEAMFYQIRASEGVLL